MSYEECPECGDDNVRRVRSGVVVCASCRAPLRDDWLADSLLETAEGTDD